MVLAMENTNTLREREREREVFSSQFSPTRWGFISAGSDGGGGGGGGEVCFQGKRERQRQQRQRRRERERKMLSAPNRSPNGLFGAAKEGKRNDSTARVNSK